MGSVRVGDRVLALTNLDKVIYPGTGTTKAELIAYYAAVSPALLARLAGRPVTRRRWPDGVDAEGFFEKNAPAGTPEWIERVRLAVPSSTKGREYIDQPLVEELAAVVWLVQLAALELHVPQWQVPTGHPRRRGGTGRPGAGRPGTGGEPTALDVDGRLRPDQLVLDLDPGPPAGLAECARVAHDLRELLTADGLTAFPVTSGSKGLQLYVPLTGEQDADQVREYARGLAEQLAARRPDLVVARMTKAVRSGKVFIDHSQNHPAKTTICPYSLRGLSRPWAAAPRDWAELHDDLVQLSFAEVRDRYAADGDLLAGLPAAAAPLPQAPPSGTS